MNQAGEYGLMLACLAAWGTVLTALLAIWFNDRLVLGIMRAALAATAGFLTLSSAVLLHALLASDFTLKYVGEHTERALPIGYKIAAFWAGQQGSILLWGWLISLMGAVAILLWGRRTKDRTGLVEEAATGATLAAIVGFFAGLMVFVGEANPFAVATVVPPDGGGLNPLLQNVAMVAHPPTLFLGYAGYAVPFAMLCGALIAGRRDSLWLTRARIWMLISWVSLTVGIVLGAWWAYVVLGWGGYWAWDPVENASLLPWLTGTALLHSVITQQRRGMFKIWTAGLLVASFVLCLVGTYITRSGVVQSVHSFGESPIGTSFLVFLAVMTLGSGALIIGRLGVLKAEQELTNLLSREGLVLFGNVLLVGMMGVTLAGTLSPVWTRFLAQPVTISAPFYNKAVLVPALVLAGLMAAGPLLGYGQGAVQRSWRALTAMGGGAVLGLVAAGVLVASRSGDLLTLLWTLAAGAVVGGIVAAILADYVTTVYRRLVNVGENVLVAAVRAILTDTRRWGAQIVHLGIGMIILGVTGSSLYNHHNTHTLNPGESASLGRYTLTYQGTRMVTHENYQALEATVVLANPRGGTQTLHPERRLYEQTRRRAERTGEDAQWYSEVAIRYALAGDVYMNLAAWDDRTQQAALEVIINPLVNWIWIGGILLTLGGLVCLLPRRRAAIATAAEETPAIRREGFPVGTAGLTPPPLPGKR